MPDAGQKPPHPAPLSSGEHEQGADSEQLTDEQLMERLAQGSHAAFEALLARYETPVITFCYAFMRNREAAEDLAQETFMRVFRNSRRYQPVAKFTTWLYRIAANLCINELKKGKLRQSMSLDEPAGPNPEGSKIIDRLASNHASPLSDAERREAQGLISIAIDHLPDEQRTTLILVEFHHMPYQEIAEILGVTVSAIKMRVKRARETLREMLKVLESQGKDG
ncbi:MAG: RNA polymerase sigma factor [Planctomycetota bacterium]|nr:RNA polymerase sigma factor [Planctomycetota bacterium]